MEDTFTRLNVFSSYLSLSCMELIENELNYFFNEHIESAYEYSLIIVKNFNNYSNDNFSKRVLNCDELMQLIYDILYRLNYFRDEFSDIDEEYIKYQIYEKIFCLNKNIIQKKTNYDITRGCEKIIDKTLLKSVNLFYSGIISNYIFDKINFASLILGNNNSKSLVKMYEKDIYNKIKGVLINIKIDIRNLIFEYVIKQKRLLAC